MKKIIFVFIVFILLESCKNNKIVENAPQLNCLGKNKLVFDNIILDSIYSDSLKVSVLPDLTCLFDSIKIGAILIDSMYSVDRNESMRDTSMRSICNTLNFCLKTQVFSNIGASSHTRFNSIENGFFKLHELFFKSDSTLFEAKRLMEKIEWGVTPFKVKRPSIAIPNWSVRSVFYKHRLIIIFYTNDNVNNTKKMVSKIENYLSTRL
jgi:hypothetical protein